MHIQPVHQICSLSDRPLHILWTVSQYVHSVHHIINHFVPLAETDVVPAVSVDVCNVDVNCGADQACHKSGGEDRLI